MKGALARWYDFPLIWICFSDGRQDVENMSDGAIATLAQLFVSQAICTFVNSSPSSNRSLDSLLIVKLSQ